MPEERKPVEFHAVVEILGHRQIAGRCTEEPIAGVNMLRVDVPAVAGWPPHTKFFGGGSIYAIHPCSEGHATAVATRIAEQWGYTPLPVSLPDMAEASETLRELRAVKAGPVQIGPGVAAGWERDGDFEDDPRS